MVWNSTVLLSSEVFGGKPATLIVAPYRCWPLASVRQASLTNSAGSARAADAPTSDTEIAASTKRGAGRGVMKKPPPARRPRRKSGPRADGSAFQAAPPGPDSAVAPAADLRVGGHRAKELLGAPY